MRSVQNRSFASAFLGIFLVVLAFQSACSVVAKEGAPGEGEEGEPCTPWGSYACAADGTTELFCEEGWYVFSRECSGGCLLTGDGPTPLLSCQESDAD